MLALDDPRWAELDHAFGVASDTPASLEALRSCAQLPRRWQDEPLSTLWDSLCHQGDPCSAAYAAVPHLVDILAERPAREGDHVLHLVGAIVAAEHRGPKVTHWLAEDYKRALARAAEVVRDWLAEGPVESRMAFLLLVDHAAVTGERMLARAMMALEPGEVDFECHGCGYRGMAGIGDEGVEIDPLEWVSRASADGDGLTYTAYHDWAVKLGHAGLARQVADMDSTLACPECSGELRVLEAIVAAYP